MSLRDRIFALIFRDRRKKRRSSPRPVPSGRRGKDAGEPGREGYDGRYFVRHRR